MATTHYQNWYVYTLAYPDGTVFYVGKGTGSRIFAHEKEAQKACDCKKCHVIRSIFSDGKPVQKRIVYETLNEQDALNHEQEVMLQYATTIVNILKPTSVKPVASVSGLRWYKAIEGPMTFFRLMAMANMAEDHLLEKKLGISWKEIRDLKRDKNSADPLVVSKLLTLLSEKLGQQIKPEDIEDDPALPMKEWLVFVAAQKRRGVWWPGMEMWSDKMENVYVANYEAAKKRQS